MIFETFKDGSKIVCDNVLWYISHETSSRTRTDIENVIKFHTFGDGYRVMYKEGFSYEYLAASRYVLPDTQEELNGYSIGGYAGIAGTDSYRLLYVMNSRCNDSELIMINKSDHYMTKYIKSLMLRIVEVARLHEISRVNVK